MAKAYLDQLERAKTIDGARAKTLRAALDQGDKRQKSTLDELDRLAAELTRDAAAPNAPDAKRYAAMAEAITARTARLR